MLSIIYAGIAVVLAVITILVVSRASAPVKAQKWERAEIMKQLLARAEEENISSTSPAPRLRTVAVKPRTRPVGSKRSPATSASRPVRSSRMPG